MYCKNCGNKSQEEQEVCSNCGNKNTDIKKIPKIKETNKTILIISLLILGLLVFAIVMNNIEYLMIVVLFFFICLIGLFLGIVNPNMVIRWGKLEKRNRKNVIKYYGIGAIVLYVLIRGCAIIIVSGSTNISQSVSNNYNQQDTSQAIKVTAKDLYDAYDKNEISADNDYKGKMAIVTGEISNITSSGDKICIDLLGNSITQFSCYFNSSQAKKIGGLQKGKTITFRGTIRGKSWNICIDDCILQ
jgi:hypothetical protein